MGDWLCVAIVVGWVVSPIGGYAIGQSKGQGGSGFVWGLVLGPLGWLVVFLLPDRRAEAEAEELATMAPSELEAVLRVKIEAEERSLRQRIELEERIRAEVRAKLEAEKK